MSLILIIIHVCHILLENQKNKTKQPGTGVAPPNTTLNYEASYLILKTNLQDFHRKLQFYR